MTNLILFIFLLSFVSCGHGFNEKNSAASMQMQETDEQYNMTFKSMNTKIASYSGYGSISILDNQFWARIRIEGPQDSDAHAQYLHEGHRCPTMDDDRNGDGIIDVHEVLEVSGRALIPFDGSLNSQRSGLDRFPVMKGGSMYYYSQSCSYQWLMDDLYRGEDAPSDILSKLPKNQLLDHSSRVVIIYGVNASQALPSSVETVDGYPSQAMLPIACAVIQEGKSQVFN